MRSSLAKISGNNEKTWRCMLDDIPQRPGLYLGGPEDRLLRTTIGGACALTLETKALQRVKGARLSVSPHQYLWQCRSGPLRREIEQLVSGDTADILYEAIWDSWFGILKSNNYWTHPFHRNINPLHEAVSSLQVADIGILGVRTSHGLWWQIYQEGWPLAPPICSHSALPSIGFVVGGSFSKKWYEQLPFTEEMIASAIPAKVRPLLDVDWHAHDPELPTLTVPLDRSDQTLFALLQAWNG